LCVFRIRHRICRFLAIAQPSHARYRPRRSCMKRIQDSYNLSYTTDSVGTLYRAEYRQISNSVHSKIGLILTMLPRFSTFLHSLRVLPSVFRRPEIHASKSLTASLVGSTLKILQHSSGSICDLCLSLTVFFPLVYYFPKLFGGYDPSRNFNSKKMKGSGDV